MAAGPARVVLDLVVAEFIRRTSVTVPPLPNLVIINIGTATIGSTVGTVTLGTPVISGRVGEKLSYVLPGAKFWACSRC